MCTRPEPTLFQTFFVRIPLIRAGTVVAKGAAAPLPPPGLGHAQDASETRAYVVPAGRSVRL